MAKQKATLTAEEIEARFDAGDDISDYLDWQNASRPALQQRRVNLDLPAWMIATLDKEAKRIGVTRQSVMKLWLSERIKAEGIVGPDNGSKPRDILVDIDTL